MPQNMARGLKFRINVVERLYYPFSGNKGADQLRGDREADLRLCFRIYAKSRFSHDAAQNDIRMRGMTDCHGVIILTLTFNSFQILQYFKLAYL